MSENGARPAIRFTGFTDAWEQRELSDVADIVGGGTPSTIINEYWGGDVDWYAPAEIGEQIFVKGSQNKITEMGLQNSSAKILPVGTVLFTSRAGIGNTAILAKKGATNQGFQSIVPHKDELDSYFIFSRTHELKRYGETVGAGSTFTEVSGKQMAKMPISIPEIPEQKKISQLFSAIDDLITLHQRKYDKLVNIKKAMLGKMFPQNGASVPEIRIAGFIGAWKKRKLEDVVEFYSGLTYSPTNVVDSGGTLVLRSSNVKDGEIKKDDTVFVASEVVNSYNVEVGDIIVVVRNGSKSLIGKHAQIKEDMPCTVIGAFITGIRSEQPAFMNALLNTHAFDREIEKNMGATINQITNGMFRSMAFFFPKNQEQFQIGVFFQHLDHLIALQQRKLQKLRNFKMACQEKMFV